MATIDDMTNAEKPAKVSYFRKEPEVARSALNGLRRVFAKQKDAPLNLALDLVKYDLEYMFEGICEVSTFLSVEKTNDLVNLLEVLQNSISVVGQASATLNQQIDELSKKTGANTFLLPSKNIEIFLHVSNLFYRAPILGNYENCRRYSKNEKESAVADAIMRLRNFLNVAVDYKLVDHALAISDLLVLSNFFNRFIVCNPTCAWSPEKYEEEAKKVCVAKEHTVFNLADIESANDSLVALIDIFKELSKDTYTYQPWLSAYAAHPILYPGIKDTSTVADAKLATEANRAKAIQTALARDSEIGETILGYLEKIERHKVDVIEEIRVPMYFFLDFLSNAEIFYRNRDVTLRNFDYNATAAINLHTAARTPGLSEIKSKSGERDLLEFSRRNQYLYVGKDTVDFISNAGTKLDSTLLTLVNLAVNLLQSKTSYNKKLGEEIQAAMEPLFESILQIYVKIIKNLRFNSEGVRKGELTKVIKTNPSNTDYTNRQNVKKQIKGNSHMLNSKSWRGTVSKAIGFEQPLIHAR